MKAVRKISILVVDDHPIVRVGISAIINAQPDMFVVAEASTGEESIALFEKFRPEITLMDLRLPQMSGVEAIHAIRAKAPDACFVVLTTYEGDEDIYRALEAGARAYIIKGMPHEALVDALHRVHAGDRVLPPPVLRALASRNEESELSVREREVLSRLARGECNKEIAAHLGISEATVKCHVSMILDRLNAADRTQAVVLAIQRGLVHV